MCVCDHRSLSLVPALFLVTLAVLSMVSPFTQVLLKYQKFYCLNIILSSFDLFVGWLCVFVHIALENLLCSRIVQVIRTCIYSQKLLEKKNNNSVFRFGSHFFRCCRKTSTHTSTSVHKVDIIWKRLLTTDPINWAYLIRNCILLY